MGHHVIAVYGSGHPLGLISQESLVRIQPSQPSQVHASLTLNGCLLRYVESLWTSFFTALAQLDRALDYESGGWEFESLRWYQSLPRSSEEEHSLDKRKADISKLSVATIFFTQEHSMKHAKP
jgi:hypothetical protein